MCITPVSCMLQAFSIHCSQDRESQPYQQTHPCAPERFTRSRPPARKPAPAPPRVLTEKERQQEAAAAAECMAQQALRVAQRERERCVPGAACMSFYKVRQPNKAADGVAECLGC